MRPDYGLYVRYEVYQALRSIGGRDRQRILRFLESLSGDPFREGDYSETDGSGRRIQVVILGKYALYCGVRNWVGVTSPARSWPKPDRTNRKCCSCHCSTASSAN